MSLRLYEYVLGEDLGEAVRGMILLVVRGHRNLERNGVDLEHLNQRGTFYICYHTQP